MDPPQRNAFCRDGNVPLAIDAVGHITPNMYRFLLLSTLCLTATWAVACGSSTQSVTSPSTSKCTVSATATPASFSATGGTGTLNISTTRECQWTATATTSWIQLSDSSIGQGEASRSFTVTANTDPAARQAAINVGDQKVAVAQEAAPCVFTVSPDRDSVGSGGGQRTITVTASSPKCAWTARSDSDWLVVTDGTEGTGNGQVRYEARATSGPARSGNLMIAGRQIAVVQGSGCNYTLDPASQDVAQGGGPGRLAVNTSPGCSWTAVSNAPWVTVTTGASGTGTGAVTFNAAANDMGVPARTAAITVNGQTFRITQPAGPKCTYTLNGLTGTIQGFPAAGGPWNFTVTTGAACAWTAVPSAAWITITSSPTGTGNGRVTFSVSPNPPGNPERAGTITVGLSIFTIIQGII